MRLQVGGGLDHVGRADQPPDPPAGHRVGLGHAVDDHGLLGELRHRLQDRGEARVAVDQVLVDLVGEDPQAVLQGPAADRLDLLGAVDRAGRVRRRDEQQHLGALGPGRLQLLHRGQVAGGLVGDHVDRHAAGQLDRLGVGGPVRGRHDDLVAGVQQGREGVVDGLLAAVGDQYLVRRDRHAGVAQRLVRDRLLQLRQPAGRRVLVVLRVLSRLDRRLDDVRRGREVGLSGAEADHRPAGRLERLGLGVHGQGRGLGDGADAPGDPGGGVPAGRGGS